MTSTEGQGSLCFGSGEETRSIQVDPS
ncbi:hypothetical protein EYF80_067258 [Liparis tanakae]|uniref:Uncharacterized protein n=1 Tax=Liparis tanakae TaxID=230148 RepID=A0A4Z2E1P1_9TELE|nr:hypothetical protein EYF80_067258 [Liparis tanakae]